jgi:hypothetical protein
MGRGRQVTAGFVTHPPDRALAFLVEVQAGSVDGFTRQRGPAGPVRRVHIIEARGTDQALALGELLGRLEFGTDVDLMTAVVRNVPLVEGLGE